MISVPPANRINRTNAETVQHPRETAQNAAENEIPDFDETGFDANLGGTNEITTVAMIIPQRVFTRVNWKIDMTAIAHRIWEIGLPPKILVTSGPAFGAAGNPPEIVRVNPLIKNRVPSVVMKEGISSTTVTRPLTIPITAAGRSPTTMAGKGRPASCT